MAATPTKTPPAGETATTTGDTTKTSDDTPKLSPAAQMFADLKSKAIKVEAAKVFVDKKTLIGVPFVITSWALIPSESSAASRRKVVYAEVKYVTEDGIEGSFRDSSMSGIKNQLVNLHNDSVAQGVWFETPIFVPEGIIAREFDTENAKGEKIKSTVHVLSA